jgi:phosphoglycerate dehydrogenase-like enzyme
MRIAVLSRPDFAALEQLRRDFPDAELVVGDSAGVLRDRMDGIEVVLVAPRFVHLLTDVWREIQSAQWIHSLAAGVDSLPFDLLRRSSIVVTNSRGLYGDALGEFAIAAMLWFAKDLRRLARNQASRTWEPYTVERLEGATVGIIGYGGIGQAVGRRAEALGMRVLPVRRRGELGDPTIEDVLAESDYAVVATPPTPATHRMIDARRLALLRAHAVLINVSRGLVIDEAALIAALRDRRIRGAALDVFETEPLPPESPLWTLDNVLVSPHTADHTADSHQRAMAFFIENLRRFQRGESLENVVDKDEQY